MQTPLRIAIDVRHIRDFGIGSYIRNLVLALQRRQDDLSIFLAGRDEDLRNVPKLDKRFQNVAFPRSDQGVLNQITFPLFLRQFSLDLAHIPLNSVPLLMQKPYVVTVHDMSSILFRERGPSISSPRREYRRLRFRRGLHRANRVIAVSQATQRDLESLMNVPPERITQIYGAIDPKFFEPLGSTDSYDLAYHRRQLMERHQIHYPYLLYAGTIRPQKNIPKLIESFSVLRRELANHPVFHDLRLLVIGDEIAKYPEVRRSVVHHRLEGAVRFFGFVSFDVLRLFYSAAEAFIFPSVYEGFGLPPLEAMACGVPVVCSNQSSIPEAVGDAAELVNPDNVFDIVRGMREVLLSPSYREDLIERGKHRVARFNWDRTADQVMNVYREVIAEHSRKP